MNINFKESQLVKGIFKIEADYRQKDGTIMSKTVFQDHNYIMLSGRTAMRNLIAGYNMDMNYVTKLAFGNNASSVDVTATPKIANEVSASEMQDVAVVPVTYSFPDDYSVTFLGYLDFDQANGTYINEYMLRNNGDYGIAYKTTRSIPKEQDIRLRVYWTIKYLIEV